MSMLLEACERGRVPDALIRSGMRALMRRRLRDEYLDRGELQFARFRERIASLGTGPVAVHADAANAQHYELPAAFFQSVLGPHLKYSCALWNDQTRTLEQAEAAMLALTCERAGLADGMNVLELGCGWGSLSLWMAEHYPGSRITAVSNSAPQREWIEARASERGIGNLRVLTCDMNAFAAEGRWDRVVSVEMFEHMRNWSLLLERIAGWLEPEGRLFVHVFCHRELLYPFEVRGRSDWMAEHFFTGGIMPAELTLAHLQRDLELAEQWRVSGEHYRRTARAWLERTDASREALLGLFAETYGQAEAARWLQRWRMFFMAVEELFGYRGGSEWFVTHCLLRPRS